MPGRRKGDLARPLIRRDHALTALLAATRQWSGGAPIDHDRIAVIRSTILTDNHVRYVRSVPAYRALTTGLGLDRRVSVLEIMESLVVDDGLFKGYDARWLSQDLGELTRWLDTVCIHHLDGIRTASSDLASWREEMKRHGIAVTFSSGTTGNVSLVPRDHATLAVLRASSGVRLPWAAMDGDHDCLLLVPAGLGLGIQSGAVGLAARAVRSHFLREEAGEFSPEDFSRAAAFARTSTANNRPLLVYGGPAALAGLVQYSVGEKHPLSLPSGSLVVTGGGWKSGAWAREELFALTEEWLGVATSRCLDTYSTAELNTVIVTCTEGRYHVPPSVEVLVLDHLMQPVPGEAAGRLAFLDPFALSYPGFIATHDAAAVRMDLCPCGLTGVTIVGAITRLPEAAARGCGLPTSEVL